VADSIFERDGELFLPTGHARGPWSTESLHGGAPAALFAGAFERMEPGAELRIARIGVEYLRPLTFAPLELSTGIARPGRRVQELTGELRSAGEVICRASALRVQSVPEGLPSPAEESPRGDGDGDGDGGEGAPPIPPIPPWPPAKLPGPSAARPAKFALNRTDEESFAATAMEMRWFGDPWSLGPGRVWMRMRLPLLAGEALTPLMRAAAVADFANGASAALPFDRYLFINADLTIHLARQPRGEWIALDARTVLEPGGSGLSDSVLHDEHGPFARAFQTLVVQLR
jgi:hypothetical protein